MKQHLMRYAGGRIFGKVRLSKCFLPSMCHHIGSELGSQLLVFINWGILWTSPIS